MRDLAMIAFIGDGLLNPLYVLSLVEKRIPVTEKNPEKSKKGLYYIEDNFKSFDLSLYIPIKGQGDRLVVLREVIC